MHFPNLTMDANNEFIQMAKNLADGIEPTDVCTLRQVLIYDSEKKVFKWGDKEFNLTMK